MRMQNMKRSETTEQITLFNWAERTKSILPELDLMYHVPNEGKRTDGGILKAAGLKNGVPDICLPVPHNGFHGLYIELKYGKNKATKAQENYMTLLKEQNYKTAVCYGFEEAREAILEYLNEPGRMPKDICVQAPWVNGKCEGILRPSKMFSRKECTGCKHHKLNKAEATLKECLHNVNEPFATGIINTIYFLSSGKLLKNCNPEETLETVSKNLALLVKGEDITINQAAAVLTVAMDAYDNGKKKESIKVEHSKNKKTTYEE